MERYISCYYSYNNCVILQGYVDEKKILVITDYFEGNKIPVEQVAKRLDDIPLIKPWVNLHSPLTTALYDKCETIDFSLENQSEVTSLLELFNQLRDENRIKYDGDFRKEEQIKALQLLLKATMKDLVREPLVFGGTLGAVEPIYPYQNPYGLYSRNDYSPRKKMFGNF